MQSDEYTNQEFFLDVGDGHQLYVHDWGKKDAKTPIIFLHGGPGSGCNDGHKSMFNPDLHRVIFFDQRGSGKSLPAGLVEHNTTDDMIDDIEKITDKLGVKKVIITGGSWGACLALAYALKHPGKVKVMVLRGIYTASKSETAYLDEGGFRTHFPEVWEQYKERAPKKYADNPSKFHYAQAFGDDPEAAKKSIYAYSELESSLLRLDDRRTPGVFEEFDPNNMKIELHYLKHDCFMPDRYIINNAHKLKMPIWLVQGRYDMVCPPITAYELHQRLPDSQLLWSTAGHSGSDRSTFDITRATLLQMAGE